MRHSRRRRAVGSTRAAQLAGTYAASNATPIGAAAKFAVAGKATGKDPGAMARGYGHVYVAQVAFGAKDERRLVETLRTGRPWR